MISLVYPFQLCDSAITRTYTGMSSKERTDFPASIVGDKVSVNSIDGDGLKLAFDKKPSQVIYK